MRESGVVERGASFATRLEGHGDRPAVRTDGVELTYRDLAARADEVATALGPVRRLVLVRAGNDLGSLLGYLGALRGGHVPLVADSSGPLDAALAATYAPDAVVTGGPSWAVEERHPASAHALHPDLALVLSTSGSTGSPKLVRLSHRNLDANAEAIATYLELADDDRAVTSLPMHYCYGLSVVNSHLAAGAGLVLTDRSVVDRCFWDAFAAHGGTSFAGVPYTFDLLDRIGFDAMSVPGLRSVTQAGGRLAPERVRRYAALAQRDGWRFYVMYGQTEATARMAYLPPDRALSHPDCIGVPIPGGSFELAHDGELVYRGPNVMLGYAREPADLSLGATVDALHTGDIATRTPEGLYRIVGRRSRFVKLFGLRIDLDHVERLLADAGVEALCAGDDTRVVVAARATLLHRARAVVRERVGLPPAAVHVIDIADIPRLANGKPDYAALLAAPAPAQAEDGATAAGPDVATVYAAVLGCDDVGDDDTFVGLGGDSLSYVEASVALERVLGHLPPQWPTTPVGELARRPAPPRAGGRMETNVVVRAVAVTLVVAAHADVLTVEGGAHALLAVAGFNFARFQLASGRILRSVARIAVPSMAWIGVMAAARDDFGLPHVLLVNGLVGGPGTRWSFWFVEAMVQLLVPLAIVLSVRRVRAWERARPLLFAGAVLGLGLLVRFDMLGLPDLRYQVLRPHEVLWLFAVGWASALVVSNRQRVVLSGVAAVALHGFFDDPAREAVVLAAVLLLVWVRAVPVAPPLRRLVAAVAGASLYIYLTHWAVYPWVQEHVSAVAAVVASLVVGMGIAAIRARGVLIKRPLLPIRNR